MLIVDDVVYATPEASTSYQVRAVLHRHNEAPEIRWESVCPTYLVWADTPEEAVMAYKAHLTAILLNNLRSEIESGEFKIQAWAKEAGESAPYQYGDYAEVLVTADDTTEKWEQVVIYSAVRHSPTTRWEVHFIVGWVGKAALMSRAWCDDNGLGEVIRPSAEQGMDIVIPLQEVCS